MKNKHLLSFIPGFLAGALVFGSTAAFAVQGVTALPSENRIVIDGAEVPLSAYIIEDSNYVRLRDIADTLGFRVEYDGDTNTVTVDTSLIIIGEAWSGEAPPEVGTTPGDILIKTITRNITLYDKAAINANYTEAYKAIAPHTRIGTCAWYAKARFTEVHDVEVNLRAWGNPKNWIVPASECDDLKVVTEIEDIRSQAIAVYAPKNDSEPGHAVFIEYVEYAANGEPLNVYLTEANGFDTLNIGEYDAGHDGVVRKVMFDYFKERGGDLLGYIAPNQR